MNCLPAAFAHLLNLSVEEVVKQSGHTGKQIVWPDLPIPQCYRAWHIQEMIMICLKHGYYVTPFERITYSAPSQDVKAFTQNFSDEFHKILANLRGVLAVTNYRGNGHALVFNKGKFYDPIRGREVAIKEYLIADMLWIFGKVQK